MNLQIENIACLLKASSELNIPFEVFDENSNLVVIKTPKKELLFSNYSNPFNTQSFSAVCRDKDFTYRILKDLVLMPEHFTIVDKNYLDKSLKADYTNEITEIVSKIGLPIVLKPNSLSKSINVILCNSKEEVLSAVLNIFSDNKNYDYVALLQKPINTKNEFRVVVFKNEIVLVYSRDEWIRDEALIQKIRDFVKPVSAILDLGFVGMDIILDNEGKFWLLEINTAIGFEHFIKKYGEEPVIDLYKNILKNYL